jgi:Tfp pilus assembly protein PilX
MPTEAGQRGSAVLLSLLLVILMGSISLAVADLVSQERRITSNRERATRALAVARAGLALAKRELAHNAAWAGGAAIPFGEGESFDVEVVAVGASERRVLSTGRVEGGERAVEALLDLGDPAIVGDESVVSGSWRER